MNQHRYDHVKSTITSCVRTQTKLKVVFVVFGMFALVLPFAGRGQIPEKTTPAITEQPPITAKTEQTPVQAIIAGQGALSPKYRAELENKARNAISQIEREKTMIKARPEQERLYVDKVQKLFKQATSASRWDRANRCYSRCSRFPPTEAGDCNFACLVDHILCNGGCFTGPLGTLFNKL